MSTFEELLSQSQKSNDYEMIHEALLELILGEDDHYTLCNKIQPFLPHVNDGGNLSALHVQLQNNSGMNMEVVYRGLVKSVVNASTTNPRLKQVLKVIIGMDVNG